MGKIIFVIATQHKEDCQPGILSFSWLSPSHPPHLDKLDFISNGFLICFLGSELKVVVGKRKDMLLNLEFNFVEY